MTLILINAHILIADEKKKEKIYGTLKNFLILLFLISQFYESINQGKHAKTCISRRDKVHMRKMELLRINNYYSMNHDYHRLFYLPGSGRDPGIKANSWGLDESQARSRRDPRQI